MSKNQFEPCNLLTVEGALTNGRGHIDEQSLIGAREEVDQEGDSTTLTHSLTAIS